MATIYSLKRTKTSEYLERFKFLLLNLIVEERRPTEEELLELTYIRLRILDETDIGFVQSNKLQIREIFGVHKILTSRGPVEVNCSVARRYLEGYDSKIRIHNAYFGRLKQNPTRVLLKKRSTESQRKIAVRRRFIGVGYRDHGTMKNIATDGSPHWKEVSTDYWYQEKMKKENLQPFRENGYWYEDFHRIWDRIMSD